MPTQQQIPGTESPDRIPEIDERLFAYLDARDEQKAAGDRKKTREHVLLVAMAERGLDRYPYVDPKSGKKRYFVADRTPRPRTIAAVSKDDKPRRRREQWHEREQAKARAELERDLGIESRRVSRESVAAETDPFAATRNALETP